MHKSLKMAGAALSVLVLSYGAMAQTALPPNYQIDPVHSLASFSVAHMGISHVRGQFTKMTGDGYFNGKDYKDAFIEATIDTTSVDTREPKRDGHLKSADFFDVAQFPTMTFKSKRIRAKAGGKFEALGDLTIHGVTKAVLLEGSASQPTKDPGGNTRIGANASTTVDRKDFGLVWNKTLDNGGSLVGDSVDITLDVELVLQKPQANQ